MSEIRVKENESLESALRRFKRSCAKEGVIAEVKKREHYVSPSLKRKQKSEAARKNKKVLLIPLDWCSKSPLDFQRGFLRLFYSSLAHSALDM